MRQAIGLVLVAMRSLPSRLGLAAVVVVGVAGVVAVLCFFLSMFTSIADAMISAGRADRALVLRRGSDVEIASRISQEAVALVASAPGIKRHANGSALSSAEIVRVIDVPNADGELSSYPIRGVSPAAFDVRPELQILAGRRFRPGAYELIVGRTLSERMSTMGVGSYLEMKGTRWLICGVFSMDGGVHESEIMGDAATLQSLYRSSDFSAVTVRLESPGAFDVFSEAVRGNPAIAVDVKREAEYFLKQSGASTQLLVLVAYIVGALMAIGAMLAAANALHTAVAARKGEIATLRAIGFTDGAVMFAVLLESLLFALVGALVGVAVCWALFNDVSLSTSAGGTGFSQTAFRVRVTSGVLMTAALWALAIGFLGGLAPAIRAARTPLALSLRA